MKDLPNSDNVVLALLLVEAGLVCDFVSGILFLFLLLFEVWVEYAVHVAESCLKEMNKGSSCFFRSIFSSNI